MVGAASSTTAAQLVWMGVRLYRLPDDAIAAFVAGLLDGVADQLQDQNVCDRLRATITGDPLGFYWGYCLGVLTGLKTGLVNLVGTIADLFKLSAELAPTAAFALTNPSAFLCALGGVLPAALELTDRSKRELKLRQLAQARRIGAATKLTDRGHRSPPGRLHRLLGRGRGHLGANAGVGSPRTCSRRRQSNWGRRLGRLPGKCCSRSCWRWCWWC